MIQAMQLNWDLHVDTIAILVLVLGFISDWITIRSRVNELYEFHRADILQWRNASEYLASLQNKKPNGKAKGHSASH